MKRAALSLLVTCGICHTELILEQPAQEFQQRSEDGELTVNFTFQNTGAQPGTITKATPSCGCTTAELPKKPPFVLALSFVYWRIGEPATARQVQVSVGQNPASQIVAVASSTVHDRGE